MAYEKLTSTKFHEGLASGKYESATGARRAIGKADWPEKEKDKARVAVDSYFATSSTPKAAKADKPKGKPGRPPKAKVEAKGEKVKTGGEPAKPKGKPGRKPKSAVVHDVPFVEVQAKASAEAKGAAFSEKFGQMIRPLQIPETPLMRVNAISGAISAVASAISAVHGAASKVTTDELQLCVDYVMHLRRELEKAVEEALAEAKPVATWADGPEPEAEVEPGAEAAPVETHAISEPEPEETAPENGFAETARRRNLFESTIPSLGLDRRLLP